MTGLAVLLVFVRCLHDDEVNELLLYELLPTLTNGIEIYKNLDNFHNGNKIAYQKYNDICTNGAHYLVKGVVAWIMCSIVGPANQTGSIILRVHNLAD
jgi:hypothetical protein